MMTLEEKEVNDAYSIKSPVTRAAYLRRLKTFFSFVGLNGDGKVPIEEQCQAFVENSFLTFTKLSRRMSNLRSKNRIISILAAHYLDPRSLNY